MLRDPSDVDPTHKDLRYKGLCVDLLLLLESELKFNFTLYVVNDGNYGSINDSTQEWNGMVGELVKKVSHRI